MQLWLAQNSLYTPGRPQSHRGTPEIKGMCYQALLVSIRLGFDVVCDLII